MFDFIHSIFAKIVVSIAGGLIAIGGAIGGNKPTEPVASSPAPIEVATSTDAVTQEVQTTPKVQAVAPPVLVKKPVIKAPDSTAPVDVCINIEGIQTIAPSGFSAVAGICSPMVEKDMCPNIDGIQQTVPTGMIYATDRKICLTQSQLDALEKAEATPSSSQILQNERNDLNTEYGLKINALQAKLIEANSLDSSAYATEIFRIYGNTKGTGYPDFVDTAYKQQVVSVIYAKIDAENPVARSSNDVVNYLREQTAALNTQIAQLQNELDRKLLELQ